MIISIKKNWNNALDKHTKFLSKKIIDFLNKKHEYRYNKYTDVHANVMGFIEEIYHLLILSNKDDILNSIIIYLEYYNKLSKENKKNFNKLLSLVFNYNAFTRKTNNWNAYKLCELSKTKICPYCHHSYTLTLQKGNRGLRPTLDHFYSKSSYPHLALVLNNLIPSCNTCNSSLKGATDFFLNKHLNPLFDEENISFYLSCNNGVLNLEKDIVNKDNTIDINVTLDKECIYSKNSVETFLIKERYSFFTNEAIEFSENIINCKTSKASGIIHFDKYDESILLQFNKSSYRKYCLGKLYLDLYNQFNDPVNKSMNIPSKKPEYL